MAHINQGDDMGPSVWTASLHEWIIDGSHGAHKLAEFETRTIIPVMADNL